jgi:glycosyltransferase involved in cell wall biosynthesis
MRVTVVDPPAYTPPYDHALCSSLAARGVEVELATSRFRYASVPDPHGYLRSECFYRVMAGSAVAKAAQHPADMRSLARRVRRRGGPGVVHFQWLPLPVFDRRLVRRFPRPRVLTAHDVLPRGARGHGRRAVELLLHEMDALIVHSENGRARLVDELGLEEARVRVIPHGAFSHLTTQASELPFDPGVGDLDGRKVVLFFGLIRPYKGLEVLVEAFAQAPPDALLLVVGMPRVPLEPLERLAERHGVAERVRFVPRFVADAEVPAYFRRADLVVLPYLQTEHSGVVFTALAFGAPLILTRVGGFAEIGEVHGAARLVEPGDAGALGAALSDLLGDEAARARLSEAARRAAAGHFSWLRIAGLTIELYRHLLGSSP